ncbi:hypothetical protein PQI07_19085 [Methylobacterium sp. 092160098-2]|uniref:DUF4376 domain-containing protein n=1 Tax=Methylobacterium sp. 092160098-2 TaxID=3025129 RepID=UPI002381CF1C|nr:hypothetical protein [Methylobacterium sp. 092160098-2]MDE4912790.1 hypothetical protein [Methylobacterium sp. 092160098-2]
MPQIPVPSTGTSRGPFSLVSSGLVSSPDRRTLDAATMQTVAVAVGKWVQACYSAYRLVDGKVTAGTITTTAQIDAAFAAVTLPG